MVRLLTYNVAGLPGILSASDPAENTPRVSPLLNRYHLVLAQEDFAYHEELVERAAHPYQLAPKPASKTVVGDGLSTLSLFPFAGAERQRWAECNGYLSGDSDCFGEKGFSVARVKLSDLATVDVYNVHADAGEGEADIGVRRRGFVQLARFVAQYSKGNAIIVGGDLNLDVLDPRDSGTLQAFIEALSLNDACHVVGCDQQLVDRVLVRSSKELLLHPLSWSADPRFVDERGKGLSDHLPVGVEIAWSLQPRG
jgi:hypothetical protein